MKKFLIFVLLVIVGYLVYENFIKEKSVVKINASYSSEEQAVSADAPANNPTVYGHYKGTIKNISKDVLDNLVITYIIDAQESVCKISQLAPGKEVEFKTSRVRIRHINPDHHLQGITYDKK